MTEETYVHDGVEVKKTGRRAQKQLTAAQKKLAARSSREIPFVVEIVPLTASKDDKDFAKWVREDELYEIAPEDPETLNEEQ